MNEFLIPKIIIQTSKNRPPKHVVLMIKKMCPDWTYIHFTDDDIIRFFTNNYLEEFPNIIQKFNSIKNGAHKADLFRYYFIYLKGGVFLDSDAMLQKNINEISKDYDFFSVDSVHYCPGCIFQGFLGAKPRNEIIRQALIHAYNVDVNVLDNDYLLICKHLYNILKNKWDYKIKLYHEIFGSDRVALTVDNLNNNLIIVHYFISKTVPPEYYNETHLTK